MRKKLIAFNCIKWENGKYVLHNDPSLEITPFIVRKGDELKILSIPASPRDFGDVKKIGEIKIDRRDIQ